MDRRYDLLERLERTREQSAQRPYRDREGQVAVSAARKLFAFSLLYVFLLFAALLADHALTVVGWLR